MTQHLIGRLSELPDPSARVVEIEGREVGVLRYRENVYAYRNICPHQGGPVCEGTLLGKVEAVLAPDKTVHGHRFADDQLHIVCPWHGYEYDVTTGACAADPRVRLRSYPVLLRGDEIWLEL